MQIENVATSPALVPVPSFMREYRRYDRMMESIEERMLDAARLEQGQVVIDVGSGAGTTALKAARRVGARGEVLAIDANPRAARFVGERARASGLVQVRAVCADAETCPFAERQAHAAVSRFGTLHFAHPVKAFDNLRRALYPGQKLCFLCARAPERNAWFTVPSTTIARAVPELSERHAESAGAGPFALSDASKIRSLLAVAGFCDATLTSIDEPLCVGEDVDDALEFLFETDAKALVDRLDEETLLRMTDALRIAFHSFASDRGVWMQGSVWLVEARA